MATGKPHILNRQRTYAVSVSRLEKLGRKLCRHLQIQRYHFTVVLSNDQAIRELNRRFRRINRPTDVLSFPSSLGAQKGEPFDNSSLGDMIVSVETAYRQAIQQGHSLARELDILFIHGLLHLLGYDHETDQGQMRRKERLLYKMFLC